MKRLATVLAVLALGACAELGIGDTRPVRIILVGDSTVAEGSGWGPAFCAHHVRAHVGCINLGKGGASSGSYRAEGYWIKAQAEMVRDRGARVFVLVQFGHNDQPGKPGRSTDLQAEFGPNMARYADEARTAGVQPLLVTPLSRRQFKNGRVIEDLASWAAVMRKIAAQSHVPLLDLNADSTAALNDMGAVASLRFAQAPAPTRVALAATTGTTIEAPKTGPKPVFDYTHLGPEGSEYFAAMVAREIEHADTALAPYVVP